MAVRRSGSHLRLALCLHSRRCAQRVLSAGRLVGLRDTGTANLDSDELRSDARKERGKYDYSPLYRVDTRRLATDLSGKTLP